MKPLQSRPPPAICHTKSWSSRACSASTAFQRCCGPVRQVRQSLDRLPARHARHCHLISHQPSSPPQTRRSPTLIVPYSALYIEYRKLASKHFLVSKEPAKNRRALVSKGVQVGPLLRYASVYHPTAIFVSLIRLVLENKVIIVVLYNYILQVIGVSTCYMGNARE